jgi:hypothetical protein
MNAPKVVFPDEIAIALLRAERGESCFEDAELIRKYIEGLESKVWVHELGDDEHEFDEASIGWQGAHG